MARTLKSTGISAQVAWVIAVDDDSTIKGWTTPGAAAAWSPGSGLTLSGGGSQPSVVAGTWNGTNRDLIRVPSAGAITIDTAVAVAAPFCFFMVTRNSTVSDSSVYYLAQCAATAGGAFDSGKPVINTGAGPSLSMRVSDGSYAISTLAHTFSPNANYSVFFVNNASGDNPSYFSLEGGTITTISNTRVGYGTPMSDVFWKYLFSGSGMDSDVVAIGCLRVAPTIAEAQSINADPISALFNVSAPTVGTQPTAQSVTEPAAATFGVAFSGTYSAIQWEYSTDGGATSAGNVPGGTGATTTSYTTGATAVSTGSYRNGYRYRAVATWAGGTVASNWATLTVAVAGTAPSITVQPSNQSVIVGATAIFGVTATGSGTLTYQWQRQPSGGGGYTNISGATSSSYTTPATTITGGSANNGDTYRCVVTGDTAPPATSSVATLTVLQPVATTVSVTLTTDGTTPAASLSGLKWAFYDQVTPDLFTAAPVVKGAAETTDGSGVFSASITGTALRVGDTGYLIVTNSDGTTTQGAALKAFAAPVVVA